LLEGLVECRSGRLPLDYGRYTESE
jgi:hypothetical protein